MKTYETALPGAATAHDPLLIPDLDIDNELAAEFGDSDEPFPTGYRGNRFDDECGFTPDGDNAPARVNRAAEAAIALAELEPDASMEAIILQYVDAHKEVTFVELEDRLPGFSGNLIFRDRADHNSVFWKGVSAGAVHALHNLLAQGLIDLRKASPGFYARKGRRLHVGRSRPGGRGIHWSPVTVTLRKQEAERLPAGTARLVRRLGEEETIEEFEFPE